jgi:hypothetical protein
MSGITGIALSERTELMQQTLDNRTRGTLRANPLWFGLFYWARDQRHGYYILAPTATASARWR